MNVELSIDYSDVRLNMRDGKNQKRLTPYLRSFLWVQRVGRCSISRGDGRWRGRIISRLCWHHLAHHLGLCLEGTSFNHLYIYINLPISIISLVKTIILPSSQDIHTKVSCPSIFSFKTSTKVYYLFHFFFHSAHFLNFKTYSAHLVHLHIL